jgi:hypothetical protein
MEITATQVILLGLVATFLAQAIKLIYAWVKKPIDRKVVTVFLFAVSVILAYIFARPALPTWPVALPGADPGAYALLIVGFMGQLLAVVSAIMGFAFVVYNLLMEKVFNLLTVGETRLEELSGKVAWRKHEEPPQ